VIAALYRRWVEAICRAPRRAALLLALACVPATYFTALYFMNVHAELQELLPPESPSVKALQELHRRNGGVSNLVVIASSPDGEVNRRFIAELAGRLEARRIPEAKAIRWNVGAERDWIERRAALLLPRSRFDQILDRVDQQIEAEKRNANPLLVDLEDEEPEDGGWAQIAAELDAEAKANDRFPRGYLETADGTMVVLLVALRGSEVDIGPAKRLAGAVQAEIDQIRGGYPAELVVAFNGEVQNLIEEHAAIVSDVSVSTVLVMTLVGALITIFFRSTRAVLAVVLVLIPGLLFAFALGRLSGSVLNSNSAFLGCRRRSPPPPPRRSPAPSARR
jgi:predicted RND superfamily exporter protein